MHKLSALTNLLLALAALLTTVVFIGSLLGRSLSFQIVLALPAVMLYVAGYAVYGISALGVQGLEWKRKIALPVVITCVGLGFAEVFELLGEASWLLPSILLGAIGIALFAYQCLRAIADFYRREQKTFGFVPSPALRASAFVSADYWFVDDGVVRISLVPHWLSALVVVTLFGFFEVAAPLVGLAPNPVLSPNPSPQATVGWMGIALYPAFAVAWAQWRRRRLLDAPPEVSEKTRGILLIPWSEVSAATVVGNHLQLYTAKGTFGSNLEVYHDDVTDFLHEKLGERLNLAQKDSNL